MQKLYAFSLQHQLFCLAIIVSATLTSNSRVVRKVLTVEIYSQYARKNLDLLERGPRGIGIGNDDVSTVCARRYEMVRMT